MKNKKDQRLKKNQTVEGHSGGGNIRGRSSRGGRVFWHARGGKRKGSHERARYYKSARGGGCGVHPSKRGPSFGGGKAWEKK